jgi:DNA polymerase III epsilon subunit-like protein
MTNWTTLRYAVADVEGNGQQPPELVELAVVPIAGGVIQAPASWLVKPERPITHFASRIHGITTPDVTGKPAFGAIANEVLKALDAPALVAHNAHVDVAVLERELDGWQAPEVFDTLKLARRLLPNQPGYRLGMLVRALNLAEGLPDDLTPHRAAYDALVTARLFIRLAALAGSLEVLRGQPPEKAEEDALF